MAVVNGIRSQLLTRTAKKGSTTTLFSETLRYDSPTRGTAARYAGGLSEVMTLQGSTRNTYGFTYDDAGRLATTKRYTGTSGTLNSAAYTERGITYNRNGAFLTLQRYGSSTSTPQDNYTYTYSGPLLTGVSGKDSGSTLSASFSHDANGNTTADGRAGLTFTYNLLNLPETVTSGNTQTATYHWLADGTKYRVEDASGSGVIYAGDLTYAVTVSGGNTTYALESAEASVDGTARFLKNGTAMTPYYTIKDHLGSVRTIVNASGTVQERNDYYPFGQRTTFGASYSTLAANRQKFSGKEDQTTIGSSTLPYLDFGARMYDSKLVRWNTYDPMAEKYYGVNPYVYCNGDPLNLIDSDGKEWRTGKGKKIQDPSKVQVYIFFDPESFSSQSKKMYEDAVAIYGEGSVAVSNVRTEAEFIQDWKDMAGNSIKEVNLNYHGNNQTLMLDSKKGEYITSTGNGKTNRSETSATNVQDLPIPQGNIDNAQLNINSCKSNSRWQYRLKGSKQTLMKSFRTTFGFKVIRGTSNGVSYNKDTEEPFPGRRLWHGKWDYMDRQTD